MKTVFRRDNDGHKFHIPAELATQFDSMLEHYLAQEYGTDAYYDAEDEFTDTFWKYAEGQ